jgi:hypothetical protein
MLEWIATGKNIWDGTPENLPPREGTLPLLLYLIECTTTMND